MEEKKLTDEEIVKAMDICLRQYKDCNDCPLVDYDDCTFIRQQALDLIHRLQDENKQLKCDSYRTSWKAKFLEAKKEIERLTEENSNFKKLVKSLEDLKETLLQERAERIKQVDELTEELANERNAVITFQESANAHRLKVGEVLKQNAELQKQVDELKKWLDMKEHYIAISKDNEKQAVKDAVKELYDFAKDFFEWDEEGFVRELKEFVQGYDVEVE